MTTYSAADVAAELRREIPGVGEVKLQKLLYYVQGRHLAIHGEPAFDDEIVAFDMGPVVRDVWRQRNSPPTGKPIDDDALLLSIGYVVSKYGQLYGTQLIERTHAEAPWVSADETRRRENTRSASISVDLMQQFFAEQMHAERTIPDALFDQTRARRNLGPLPSPKPVNLDELLRRVDQGV